MLSSTEREKIKTITMIEDRDIITTVNDTNDDARRSWYGERFHLKAWISHYTARVTEKNHT